IGKARSCTLFVVAFDQNVEFEQPEQTRESLVADAGGDALAFQHEPHYVGLSRKSCGINRNQFIVGHCHTYRGKFPSAPKGKSCNLPMISKSLRCCASSQ